MKHAILVIGNKAADFILLTNTVSISWKASGENLKVEWNLLRYLSFFASIYYYVDSS